MPAMSLCQDRAVLMSFFRWACGVWFIRAITPFRRILNPKCGRSVSLQGPSTGKQMEGRVDVPRLPSTLPPDTCLPGDSEPPRISENPVRLHAQLARPRLHQAFGGHSKAPAAGAQGHLANQGDLQPKGRWPQLPGLPGKSPTHQERPLTRVFTARPCCSQIPTG